LSFLNIPPAATNHFDGLLSTEPVSIPALDVVINSLEIKGKKLGRANIEAINQTSADGGREWLLNKFNLSSEDASFNAKGVWRAPTSNAAKITNLDFQLDIHDSGALLDRMGMPNTIRAGKGKVTGNLNWQGSPITPDFPSLNGNFNIQVEKGQFLKSEPGAARLLGVLSLQSLPRRLMLDFRDVFSDGFAFDYFRGDVGIHQGIASSGNLQMKGVNAAVLMDGKADIVQETQDIKVLVIPDINAGGASLLYSAINPVIGLSTFLAQYVFRGSLNSASTEEFHIEGSWNEPKINKIEKSSDFKQ
jgi:uncharacterized protein YhdP